MTSPMPSRISARREQTRQASLIHGGTWRMCLAALGVHLSRVPIPTRTLREHVYRTIYGKKYSPLAEHELDRPLADFRSVNELFTRGVRPELRPIAMLPHSLLAPCDGRVQEIGELTPHTTFTVKDIEYSASSLLPGFNTEPFRGGCFAVIFLSPADCHRVFAPAASELLEIAHVPGGRLLVHPPYQRREFPVFTLNERIVMRMRSEFGEYILVMVAGWGVGHITFPLGVSWRFSRRKVTRRQWSSPLPLDAGQWIATFELGSTVILLAEREAALRPLLAANDQVIYGQPAFASTVPSERSS